MFYGWKILGWEKIKIIKRGFKLIFCKFNWLIKINRCNSWGEDICIFLFFFLKWVDNIVMNNGLIYGLLFNFKLYKICLYRYVLWIKLIWKIKLINELV